MGPVRRWITKYGERRIERELCDYQYPPELGVTPFFRRRRHVQRQQVFRSLVQINFYPRPK